MPLAVGIARGAEDIEGPGGKARGSRETVGALEGRARELGRAGSWGAFALGINSRILELDPDNVGALARRARCNLALDDYPAAKADFERALALGPKSRMLREDLREGLRKVEEGWDEAAGRAARQEERREARERLFREIEGIEGFEEARALGIFYASGVGRGGVGIDRPLAVAAFRRAYRADPRRRVPPGAAPDPGLFEVPTRLAAVLRAQ